MLTPAMPHYGQAEVVTQQRQQVLQTAYLAHPERFAKGLPLPPAIPTEVWINPPVATAPQRQDAIAIEHKRFHGDWNYQISPRTFSEWIKLFLYDS